MTPTVSEYKNSETRRILKIYSLMHDSVNLLTCRIQVWVFRVLWVQGLTVRFPSSGWRALGM